MLKFDFFDSKAEVKCKPKSFEKEIFGNEVVWTYLVGKVAAENPSIFKHIAGFEQTDNYAVYLGGQPITAYEALEGNSHIDMALGALSVRDKTTSGLELDEKSGSEVCFTEAKYFSDLSVKTVHSPLRNQMNRVIENLLCFGNEKTFPDKIVFTLLTPRIFKQNEGVRFYSYLYNDYIKLISENKEELAKRIELTVDSEKKRFLYIKTKDFLENRLEHLSFNWVTYEDIFEEILPHLSDTDITDIKSAEILWESVCSFVEKKTTP